MDIIVSLRREMYFYWAFFCVIFSFSSVSGQENSVFNAGDTVYIHSFNGLNVRDSAGVSSSIIAKLENSSKLVVLDGFYGRNSEIGNRIGKWLKVRLPNNTEGYVFSGYLSKIKPYDYLLNRFKDNQDLCLNEVLSWVLEYLELNDSLICATEKNIRNPHSPKYSTRSEYRFYESGSLVVFENGYESQYVILELTEISINEMLNAIEYYCEYGQNNLEYEYFDRYAVESRGDFYRRELVINGMCRVELNQNLSRTIAEFYIYSL